MQLRPRPLKSAVQRTNSTSTSTGYRRVSKKRKQKKGSRGQTSVPKTRQSRRLAGFESFTRLPAELREEVYRHTLTERGSAISIRPKTSRFPEQYRGLLHASSQVRREAMDTYLGDNTFVLAMHYAWDRGRLCRWLDNFVGPRAGILKSLLVQFTGHGEVHIHRRGRADRQWKVASTALRFHGQSGPTASLPVGDLEDVIARMMHASADGQLGRDDWVRIYDLIAARCSHVWEG